MDANLEKIQMFENKNIDLLNKKKYLNRSLNINRNEELCCRPRIVDECGEMSVEPTYIWGREIDQVALALDGARFNPMYSNIFYKREKIKLRLVKISKSKYVYFIDPKITFDVFMRGEFNGQETRSEYLRMVFLLTEWPAPGAKDLENLENLNPRLESHLVKLIQYITNNTNYLISDSYLDAKRMQICYTPNTQPNLIEGEMTKEFLIDGVIGNRVLGQIIRCGLVGDIDPTTLLSTDIFRIFMTPRSSDEDQEQDIFYVLNTFREHSLIQETSRECFDSIMNFVDMVDKIYVLEEDSRVQTIINHHVYLIDGKIAIPEVRVIFKNDIRFRHIREMPELNLNWQFCLDCPTYVSIQNIKFFYINKETRLENLPQNLQSLAMSIKMNDGKILKFDN